MTTIHHTGQPVSASTHSVIAKFYCLHSLADDNQRIKTAGRC